MRLAHLALLLAAAAAAGCQALAGYDDFTYGPGGSAGSGGSLPTGRTCATDADCGAGICLLGYCRTPCESDTQCDKGSLCLGDRTRADRLGGCRLSGDVEARCAGQCANPDLTCGIDGTCRMPCGAERTCPVNGQVCIQGACVTPDTESAGADWTSCIDALKAGTADEDAAAYSTPGYSGFYCAGSVPHACNVGARGDVAFAACDTPAICAQAAAARQTTCATAACAGGDYRCEGAELQGCNEARTGYEKLDDCASAPLCLRSTNADNPSPGQCIEPVCGEDTPQPAGKCQGGDVQACDPTQQQYEPTDCSELEKCNPTTRTCVSFAVDAVEVTRAAYQAFVAQTGKPPTGAPDLCGWNTSYEPDAACMAAAAVAACATVTKADCAKNPALCGASGEPLPCDAYPQPCVDWCDALDYCAAQGKHLCGQIGGGSMVPAAQFDDPGQSEWMNACSSGGENEWVVGQQLASGTCNDQLNWDQAPRPQPASSKCQAKALNYAGALDLSGNLAEWENSCAKGPETPDPSGSVRCHVRGGSYVDQKNDLACRRDQTLERKAHEPTVGFRCCG